MCRLTSPPMPGKDRHPSSITSVLDDFSTITGFTSTISDSHLTASPSVPAAQVQQQLVISVAQPPPTARLSRHNRAGRAQTTTYQG